MRISDWSSDVCSSNLPLPPSGVLICAMSESVDPTLPLIRTKLAPPRIGSASVERRALLETLAKHHLRRLHLLVGPAGSGKTSVLVQWRQQRLAAGERKSDV